jgi:hypothetical protein
MATTVAQPAPIKKGLEQPEEVTFRRIRITLTSRNVKNLEKGTVFWPTKYNILILVFLISSLL